MAASEKGKGRKIDLASILGLIVALGGIIGGLVLEGGQVSDIQQVTAGLIVLLGTVGAVMVNTPMPIFLGAIKRLMDVFFDRSGNPSQVIAEVLDYSHQARKNGIISLEAQLDRVSDPFLRKGLQLGVDGTDLQEIRKMLECDLETEEKRGYAEAKVYENAGGYAPTIGIIGAVLGLIQVMKHLEDIAMVGHGIAVAFVATVYGVAVANLFFLPAAGKIKARVDQNTRMKEMMLEGISSVIQGLHPAVVERKLESYVGLNSGNAERPQRSRARAA